MGRSLQGSPRSRRRGSIGSRKAPLPIVSALVALSLLSIPASSPAGSKDELRRSASRLRSVATTLQPLPESPGHRDVGEIAVLQYDGAPSTYDARVDGGELNVEARTRVGLRFYETHPDIYDFLVVFTNFDFATPDATAFHLYGRNDVEGIGKPVGSIGPLVFGSPSRLKGWIDMAAIAQYRKAPFALEPGRPGFERTLGVLAHEVGHQWLAEARYKVGDTVFDDSLGADETHWSYLLDSDGSFHYGADWRDNGDGTFTASRVRERYSALDLYLMGLVPKEKVGPITLLRNPDVDRHLINRDGELVTATGTRTITIEQIVDAMGPRRPDSHHSQKEFRLGFVFLAAPGTEPSTEDLEAIERVRQAFGAYFFALTNGVGWADTSLAVPPPAPRAASPDLERALGWLAARQALDGSWADALETRARDTSAAVLALLRARSGLSAAQRGTAWLRSAQPESLDFRARVALALEAAAPGSAERAARIAAILVGQNADGGFGAAPDFASDPLDTALALRALKALGHPADGRASAAVGALAGLAGEDGGWPAVAGGETSTVVTAEALLALLDWTEVPASAAPRARGLAALLARRNPDGGFGSSPSTPYASALALEVLLRSGAGSELVDPLTSWLQQAQLADGSWASSPHQTALVLGSLGQSLGPNLVAPADALTVSPSPAREGEVVRVSARVRNAGRVAAPATVARLYDGDPGTSAALAEAPVPPLAPGEESEVSFDYPTVDRPGLRTLYVVADAAGQVRESREDDNTVSRTLTVEGALADLEVVPGDIALSPAVAEVGEAAVVTVTVRNRGERASWACALGVSVTDPGGATVPLAPAAIPALAPGEAASVAFPWSPALEGAHVVRATADARYQVPESNETNGVAERTVRVLGSVPDGADLAVAVASVVPAALEELPQAIEVRALVENAGRAAASSTVAVIDQRTGERLGAAPVEVAGRSSSVVTVPGTVATAGSRELRVVVDPDGAIAEPDEGDNFLSIGLPDAGTRDLELSAASLSADDVEVGTQVTVTAEVRNRGTTDALSIPLQLAHESAGGLAELARTTLSLRAGETRAVALSWTAAVAAQTVPLVLRIDPFDLLVERREDNNAVPLVLRVRPSPRPNLSVTGPDVTIEPDPPAEGEPATLSAVVHNTGLVPAGPLRVRFVVGDPDAGGAVVGESPVAGVPGGEARTVSVSWAKVDVRGSAGLYVIADAAGEVEESNEGDNRAFRPFSAVGFPDLVLAASDVALEPGFPRSGEPVTIHATVRNLGGQPAGATTLLVREKVGGGEASVGTAPVPSLPAGGLADVTLAWSPAGSPGPRELSFSVDPEGSILEQDEGNNAVRRTFVVQDADVYLTEPYFSPNGDGVKDETTLAWRAGGPTNVTVSDATGRRVRDLLAGGPAEGSVTWDGRGRGSTLVPDGIYTLTLSGAAGRVLDQLKVVVDTNHSPIHDAEPAQTLYQNLTCAIAPTPTELAWMPGEDAVLVVIQSSWGTDFPPGLLRVGLDGSSEYLFRDPFYANAWLPSEAAVSPDGREILLYANGLVRVDLVTGVRTPVVTDSWTWNPRWSPDSRFIVLGGGQVVTREGTPVADLFARTGEWGDWVWSPASDRLALGPVIATRDGSVVTRLPGPDVAGRPLWTSWLADGRILTGSSTCAEYDRAASSQDATPQPDLGCSQTYLLDPDSGTFETLPWVSETQPAWSPGGDRVLTDGLLRKADGTPLWRLLPPGARVSPGAGAASFWKSWGDTTTPGRVCGGGDKSSDIFSVTSLANLTADLRVTRLAGNAGLLLRGTVADASLDRFEIDFARQSEPEIWYPIGPSSDVPVVDDDLTPWVPPGPGTYVLRLRVFDRAGNTRTRVRVVSWDRVPPLANFTQTGYFLSPTNEVKKDVRFGFLVLEPANLTVRIVGPAPAEAGAPPAVQRLVRRIELAQLGPASYTWDGRDGQGQVVPDGRYTVFLNDLPFRVQVDGTPPDIAFRIDNLHVSEQALYGPACTAFPGINASVALGTIAADRSWHVVDPHLKEWTFRAASRQPETGSSEIVDYELDAAGLPVVGSGGELKVRLVGGRPADRIDEERGIPALARHPELRFEAEDHAGNRAEIAVPSIEERIFPLGASYRCNPVLAPPVLAEGQIGPKGKPAEYALAPGEVVLVAGGSLNREFEDQVVRFSFQPKTGGAWAEVTLPTQEPGGEWDLPVARFEDLGVDPIRTYRGRFLGNGTAGEVATDPFVFRPCAEWLSAEVEFPPPGSLTPPLLTVRTETTEPVVSARVRIGKTTVELTPAGDGVFVAAASPTCEPPQYSVHAVTASGRELPTQAMQGSSCLRIRQNWPTPPDGCAGQLALEQTFPYCEGSPDELHLQLRGFVPGGSRVDVGVVGRPDLPPASFLVPDPPLFSGYPVVLNVTGEPEGVLQVRAVAIPPDPKPEDPPIEAFSAAVIDRTPAAAEVLLPPENGLACLVPSNGRETLAVRAVGHDVSPKLEIESAAIRPPDGPWSALRQVCRGGECSGFVMRGVPTELEWDATGTPGGDHAARLSFCDRAGNRNAVERRLTLTRATKPRLLRVSASPFSPNNDGRLDEVDVTFRLAEAAVLSATVHRGSALGPLVRHLFADRFQLSGDVSVAWDGRREDGQVAADGAYAIVLSAENGCGAATTAVAEVEVDRTPPDVGITAPTAGQNVRATVGVRGRATDEHFAFWRLEAHCGDEDPALVATDRNQVDPGATVAAWDTSRAPSGSCSLRLSAEDQARNGATAEVAVEVGSGSFIRQLAATPELFSPNGDGRRETTLVRFALHRPARVQLQVRRAGVTVRTLVGGEDRAAGDYEIAWDGRDAGAAPAADGDYVAWLRAEAPGQPEIYEEQTVAVVVDGTPPAVGVLRPLPGGYVPADARVVVSVSDTNLQEYVLTVTPSGGAEVELARGSRARADEALASLARFSEGPHALAFTASDLAENRSQVTFAFWIDSTPPQAAILAPSDGAFLARGEKPIPVVGRVEDANPGSWTVRFGKGAAPADFGVIGTGTSSGPVVSLGDWDTRFVPDGLYTLSLVATDKASLTAESRVSVTLDGTPPKVALTNPIDEGYVTAPGPIRGSVSDASRTTWLVEAAPGPVASAFRWEPLFSGATTVDDGVLGTWDPLPPDGPYTLRLTATDEVGLEASTKLNVVVDTTPPDTPTGLQARVTRASDTHGRVRLGWNANPEPDLAGYVVGRDGTTLHQGTHESPDWDDGERLEGTYTYSVVAVDRAGNRSQPATLRVRVDVTPPAVSFSSPGEGASVSGAVEVRGTAYSADDFAEYRLLAGAGDEPATWTLLQRSTLPVSAGRLGDWLALSNGPYRLALEAEDTGGNSARVTRRVDVDTWPPEPPVLTRVVKDPVPANWLRPEWEPSPSSDVVGTLVYRNGRLANATSTVLDALAQYAVQGQAYEDRGLPDGEHCYAVVALDGAGNVSLPSNEKCQSLDNRAPRAEIVQPAYGSRFGDAIRLVASTLDLDVQRVHFELRASGDTGWRLVGVVTWADGQPIPRWEATLDPVALALEPGTIDLRAVATDRSGNTDPAPGWISVVYGDVTPPPAPLGLAARVDGADVSLSWQASTTSDLASYRVYRDGQRIAENVTEPSLADPGRSPGTYAYAVSAVDVDGNEGAASPPATAVVYALRLSEPDWPVVAGSASAVSGDGALADTTVRVLREGEAVAEAAATGGGFTVQGVPLVPGGNVLEARGEDEAGNRSIVSSGIVLVSNAPPGPVTDLTAAVDDHEVSLAWAPVEDEDLFGYVVRRDGKRLTRTVAQETAAAVEANPQPQAASSAFDRNPDTAWPSVAATGEWTVRFPAPVLVEAVRLRFADASTTTGSYTVLAEWEGRYVPVARARGNAQLVAEHRLPTPFATASLRVLLESTGRVAEVSVERLDVTPVGTREASDPGVPDGRHRYEVTAIDRYGVEGQPATVEAGVGDVSPPGPPTGLVATPDGRDVALGWNPNPEPDIAGYVVLRDGARIATTTTPVHRDRGLANGTYAYTVIAVDRAGLESAESEPAPATIAVLPAPPGPPVILEPSDAAHPITLSASRSDVGGRADGGATVEVEANGVVRGAVPVQPSFAFAGRADFPPEAWSPVVSPDGRLTAWVAYGGRVVVRGLPGGDRTFDAGGVTGPLVFSPDGGRLAFTRYASGHELAVLDLDSGSAGGLATGECHAIAWAPDGSRLAFGRSEGAGTVLATVDAASGAAQDVARTTGSVRWIRWSPDGTQLASLRAWGYGAAELHIDTVEVGGSSRLVDSQPWPDAPPSWSPDGDVLAWTTAATPDRRVRLFDVRKGESAGEITEDGAGLQDARFSPDGAWLSYVRVRASAEGQVFRSVVARRVGSAFTATVSGPRVSPEPWPFDHEWRQGRLSLGDGSGLDSWAPEDDRFLLRDVPLQPGENLLVARATDPATGLTSADSEAVLVTVPRESFPDLAVVPSGILAVPALPPAGAEMRLRVRADNLGAAAAEATDLAVRVAGASGTVALEATVDVPAVGPGASAWLTVPWTPLAPGRYVVSVAADPEARVPESDEANNVAERTLVVVADERLVAAIRSDRATYPAATPAAVTVTLANPDRPFDGVARTTVEALDGGEVALLDQRLVSLDYGQTREYAVSWNTGNTRAGRYRFVVRVRPAGGAEAAASAEQAFDVEPGLALLARVRPHPAALAEGEPVTFALLVQNQGANAALEGATARLRVQLEGAVGPARFETVRALPSLPPAGTWEATDAWAAAGPAGRYTVLFEVERAGAVLASATALLTVAPASAQVHGTLAVVPGDVLAGHAAEARLALENRGTAGVSGYPVLVDVVSGPEATVHASVPATIDLAAGGSDSLRLAIETGSIPPGRHVVRLRGGATPATLDRASLVVHGVVAPPSPHAPADGARVPTEHPTLVVNDGSSPEGAALTYEFQLFGDEALTQPLPGATGVPETPSRTAWPVLARLAEEATYWWRARATDGFSTSAWSAVSSFTVDAVNLPPSAPVPDTPPPGSSVDSRQPLLTVRNAVDPERQPMTYELRLASDPAMTQVVAAQAGVAEGLGFTSWDPGTTLDEDATYYWTARAKTAGEAPEDFSPWSEPASFRVEAVNQPPTAPVPLRPIGGGAVATAAPALVVANATDPEGAALVYRFEIDTRPTLDSPALQVSPEMPGGAGETAWTPSVPLDENRVHYWRAQASDGVNQAPSDLASFVVNAVNEAPTAPVALDPVDGRAVGTATPGLRLRNAVDPDGDALTYEIEVRDEAGDVAAGAPAVPEGPGETTWTVPTALRENEAYTWSARASDGKLQGPWSAPAAFRVDAVVEPPTAPVPLLPVDGAVIEERRPALVVENATSPDGLALAYTFELEAVAADGSATPVERAEGVGEEQGTTAWPPSADLADGGYQWRARASDTRMDGLWSATSRFTVLVDPPPAAPPNLRAIAGDARVRLDWNASPEPDVVGYRVYRSTSAGGPYDRVAAVTVPAHDDLGLTNGVTYYYVVTARDARAESPWSNEAAARPEAPAALAAEVRYDPAVIRGECLLPGRQGHRGLGDRRLWSGAEADGVREGNLEETCRRPSTCPEWVYTTLELPAGHDPRTIDVASLRLFGRTVLADPRYQSIVDTDRDSLPELRVRFAFDAVAPHLVVGVQHPAIVGRAAGVEVRGAGRLEVLPLAADLRVTPRTLQKRSCGQDVLAKITFGEGVSASAVDICSLRLNGEVRVERVVRAHGRELTVKFDRAAIIAALPTGASVEVRVSGTIRGVAFVAVDHIRVIE